MPTSRQSWQGSLAALDRLTRVQLLFTLTLRRPLCKTAPAYCQKKFPKKIEKPFRWNPPLTKHPTMCTTPLSVISLKPTALMLTNKKIVQKYFHFIRLFNLVFLRLFRRFCSVFGPFWIWKYNFGSLELLLWRICFIKHLEKGSSKSY